MGLSAGNTVVLGDTLAEKGIHAVEAADSVVESSCTAVEVESIASAAAGNGSPPTRNTG